MNIVQIVQYVADNSQRLYLILILGRRYTENPVCKMKVAASSPVLLPCCLLGALRPRRRDGLLGTGTEWEGDDRVKGSTAETARKRPERPWTAARTMEVLRRCPLAIAQRLVHCAVAVSTAVHGQSHKDNVRCTAVDQQLGQLAAKAVQLS